MKKIILLFLLTFLLSCKEKSTLDPLQKYTDTTIPVKLFPGEISIDGIQWNNVFTKNNDQIFYCQQLPSRAQLVTQVHDGMRFNKPEVIPFDTLYAYSDPYISKDGDHLIFMSNKPSQMGKDSTSRRFQLYQSFKKENEWTDPEIVFPTDRSVGYPSKTEDGTLFYSLMPADGSRNSDIFYSDLRNGTYSKPKRLPESINSDKFEGDAFVSPDKSYIIFASFDQLDNLGFSDLCISFHLGNGQWTAAKSLGKEINSEGFDGSPFITENGKYLIFTSSRNSPNSNSFFNHYIVRFDAEDYR